MVYKFKNGFGCVVPAQVAGENLARIREENGGYLTPKAVVNDARPEGSVLHGQFEWNDEVAAEEFRVIQGRDLIRHTQVVVEPDPEQVSESPKRVMAYVSVTHPEDNTRVYVETSRAMSDDEMAAEVMEDARRQLRGWIARFGHLEAMQNLVQAIKQEIEAVAV